MPGRFQFGSFIRSYPATHSSFLYLFDNPFSFMELISVESKTNFFEKRVSEYALADKTKEEETIFDMNCEF